MSVTLKRIGQSSGGSGGGGGGDTVLYEKTFTSSDFVASGGYFNLSIPESEHGASTTPLIQVQELVASNYIEVIVDIQVDSGTGNIVIQVNQTPDLRFTGRVLILGG